MKSVFCLEVNRDDSLDLERCHGYYHQVHTQLYFTGRLWHVFVLNTDKRFSCGKSSPRHDMAQLFYCASAGVSCPQLLIGVGGMREPLTH